MDICYLGHRDGPMIFVGDTHFYQPQHNIIVLSIVPYIRNLCPSVIFLLGDIFHRHPDMDAYWQGTTFILECSKIAHTVILIGNHDMRHPSLGPHAGHSLLAYEGRDDITLVSRPTFIHLNSRLMLACPYYLPGSLLAHVKDMLPEVDLLICHQEFRGATMRSGKSIHGDKWSTSLPKVVSGHVHTRQVLPSGVCYVGSTDGTRVCFMFTDDMILQERNIIPREESCPREVIDLSSIPSHIPRDHSLIFVGDEHEIQTFKRTKVYDDLSGEVTFRLKENDSRFA